MPVASTSPGRRVWPLFLPSKFLDASCALVRIAYHAIPPTALICRADGVAIVAELEVCSADERKRPAASTVPCRDQPFCTRHAVGAIKESYRNVEQFESDVSHRRAVM